MNSKTWSGRHQSDKGLLRPPRCNVGLITAICIGAGLILAPARSAVAWVSLLGVQHNLDAYVGTRYGQVTGYSFAFTEHAPYTVTKMAGGDLKSNSVVQLASASKVPAAIAILTLVNAHELDLDTPVGVYLNEYDPSFNWPPDKADITLRMLLSHTAGFPSPPDPESGYCLNVQFTTLRDCAQYVANATLDFAPGTTFSYTGVDYQIAGYIATLVSGKSWNNFFHDAVVAPLGLKTFSYGFGGNPRIAGGGESNVSDYSKILRMLLRGGVSDRGVRLLSEDLVREMETNQTEGLVMQPLPSLFFYGGGDMQNEFSGYAFGFFILSDAVVAPSGSPGPVLADPGAYGATSWIDLGISYGGILLINSNTTVGLKMLSSIAPTIVWDVCLCPWRCPSTVTPTPPQDSAQPASGE
jgi:CubicO group peptidase (beta-lactamase class C family)